MCEQNSHGLVITSETRQSFSAKAPCTMFTSSKRMALSLTWSFCVSPRPSLSSHSRRRCAARLPTSASRILIANRRIYHFPPTIQFFSPVLASIRSSNWIRTSADGSFPIVSVHSICIVCVIVVQGPVKYLRQWYRERCKYKQQERSHGREST